MRDRIYNIMQALSDAGVRGAQPLAWLRLTQRPGDATPVSPYSLLKSMVHKPSLFCALHWKFTEPVYLLRGFYLWCEKNDCWSHRAQNCTVHTFLCDTFVSLKTWPSKLYDIVGYSNRVLHFCPRLGPKRLISSPRSPQRLKLAPKWPPGGYIFTLKRKKVVKQYYAPLKLIQRKTWVKKNIQHYRLTLYHNSGTAGTCSVTNRFVISIKKNHT